MKPRHALLSALLASSVVALPAVAQTPRPPVVERFEWIGSPIGPRGIFPSARISEAGVVFASTRSPIETTVRYAGIYGGGSWNLFGPPTTDGGISTAGISGEVERRLSDTEHGYPSHAFRLSPGNLAPHGREASTEGGGINAHGVSTGRYYEASRCASHPYRWSDDGFAVLSFLPGCSWGADINDAGQIAGSYIPDDAIGTTRTFVVQPDNGVVLLPGTGVAHGAAAINTRGLVVGGACGVDPAGGCTFDQGFLWNPATQRVDYLPMLPGDGGFSTAADINDFNQIVGYSRDCSSPPDGCDRAVLWHDGETFEMAAFASEFLAAGSRLEQAYGISTSGWIVGTGYDAATDRQQFFRMKIADPFTYVVNRTADLPDADLGDEACDADADAPGLQCTLRAAIEQSNAAPRRQKIVFNLPGPAGLPVIAVASVLPTVTDSVSIDARTQPGAGAVQLDGNALGGLADGLVLDADSVEVQGLAVTRFGGFGLVVEGGRGVVLRGLHLGTLPDAGDDTTFANGEGALRVLGTPERVTVGRGSDDPLVRQGSPNRFLGAISVAETARAAVAVRLDNVLRLRSAEANAATAALLDLGGDGPTCAAWTPASPSDPTPPPRLLHQPNDGSGATAFEGVALPGSRVVLWRVRTLPTGHGRYFAGHAEAVAEATAGADGTFALDASLNNGERFTVSATVPGRGLSELAQARRPVVALPGIGGSTLVDRFSNALHWPPLGLAPNDRLAGLALPEDGVGDGRIVAGGVFETVGGAVTDGSVEALGPVYGPMMRAFEDAGYTGDPQNDGPQALDLWRFANDWRLSPGLLADGLRAFVVRLTDATATPGDAARSCEVDFAAHSNGGVIAGVYVQRDRAHARDHVHRLVTSGTPYLGAVQALAGQTVGYVFGFDEEAPFLFPFDVEWGRMLTMARNMPGGYMLLPAPNYYAAADPSKAANQDNAVLVDLYNTALDAHGTVRTFLGAPQADDAGVPVGLGRNTPLFDQQTALHTLLGDWRAYDGPPQIYRLVGDMPVSTAVAWRLGLGPEFLAPGRTLRDAPGDTDRHRAYRERLQPLFGFGDGTVPLVSATLGRDVRLGRADFSGVDQSRWIEEFERFNCRHLPLVNPGCPSLGDGPDALPRLVEVLESGSVVRFNRGGGEARARRVAAGQPQAPASPRDVLYVSATGRLRVSVVDGLGRLTGRADTSTFVSRQIPDLDFEERTLGATVALDPEGTYTTEAVAPEGGTVYVVRVAVDADGQTGTQALFPGVALQPGGRMRVVYAGGGLALSTPWQVDATGDGAFETSAAPAATFSGGAAPLVPLPSSSLLRAAGYAADTTGRVVEVTLPPAGPGWTWRLGDRPAWIEADTVAGTVPATLRLRLRAAAPEPAQAFRGDGAAKQAAPLPQGMASDTLALTLENGTFSYTTPLFVHFDVGEPLPVELVAFAARADGRTARLAWTTASETNNIGFAVEQKVGDAWAERGFVPGHGTTTEAHAYAFDVPALAPGRHTFRLLQRDTDGAVAASPEATVEIGFEGPFFASSVVPEPVRGIGTVRVLMPAAAPLRAEVFDVLGRRVALVHDGPVDGEAVLRLDAQGWGPGVYVLRLTTSRATLSRAFTVAR